MTYTKTIGASGGDAVIVSQLIGKVRNYELNPCYMFIDPLKELLRVALAACPADFKDKLLVQQTRPRQAGKAALLDRDKLIGD